LGGELRVNQRWRPDGALAGAETSAGQAVEGLVLACGRRARGVENGWRWFGLKIHARKVASEADLEMHVMQNGYVGLTRLNNGWVNVCGLFRRPANAPARGGPPLDWLRGQPGSPLRQRLGQAVFDETSADAVAGLALRPQRAAASPECRIGDALTMIAPVTGNGMSMAFEAAEQAIEPLVAYSEGKISWPETRATIAANCDRIFTPRLMWAGGLQWLMFAPRWRAWLSGMALRSDWLWPLMFARTR